MTKQCRICKQAKPLSEFGVNRHYQTTGLRDGLNIYCRDCNRERVAQDRARNRLPRRKRSVSAHVKVLRAVRRGNRTREQIRKASRLRWDETVDVLADLALVQGVIFSKRVNGEAFFYEKAA